MDHEPLGIWSFVSTLSFHAFQTAMHNVSSHNDVTVAGKSVGGEVSRSRSLFFSRLRLDFLSFINCHFRALYFICPRFY